MAPTLTMTITLTLKENSELWAEAEQNSLPNSALEPFEFLCEIPKQLGKGYERGIELSPDFWLDIFDYKYHDNVLIKIPTWDHPVQFSALLSGIVVDSYGQYLGGGYTMISGSGIQRELKSESRKSQSMVGVNIEMSPERLATFFPGEDGQISPQLQLLVKGNDWQTLIYPESTAAVRGVVQQMINCPYQGMTKLMYLQAKVLELMALQLAPVLADRGNPKQLAKLKPKTITQIYYARDILRSRLENPPSLLELATLVGVSDRTLRRGFQELFGTTVIGYLTEQRLERAEQLLRDQDRSVSEVANQVGYAQLGHFAVAFRRKFGITPSECLLGKKSSRSHPPV